MKMTTRKVYVALSAVFAAGALLIVQRTFAAPQSPGHGDVNADDPCTHLPNPPGNAEGIEKKCPSLGSSSGIAKGDFNGDGFADLAIGEPDANIGGAAGAGDVIILFGSQDGLTNTGRQQWDESKFPFGGLAKGDAFGSALASGDFNGDGFSDLAIGIPNKTGTDPVVSFLNHTNEGAVIILYGSSNGLTTTDPHKPAPQLIDPGKIQGGLGVCRPSCPFNLDNAHFGQALAWGNFNGDTVNMNEIGDLAIGAPSMQIGNFGSKSGCAWVLFGSAGAGLSPDVGARVISEAISGSDLGKDGESLGAALTAGDYHGDGRSDLVVGAPGGVGKVFVARINTTSIDITALSGADFNLGSQANEAFGGVLASGDFNKDGKTDLAVGLPNFNISSSVTNAGIVFVLFGASGGLSKTGLQQLWAGVHFHPAVGNEAGARFGAALAAGDFNGDGSADLAIGVPFKDIAVTRNGQVVALQDAGEVDVIYGSPTLLLQPTNGPGAQVFNQDTVLGAGNATAGARFGAPLTAWNFGHNESEIITLPGGGTLIVPRPTADLAIGVPFQTVNGVSGAGAVNVLYGTFFNNAFPVSAISAESVGFAGQVGAHFGAGLY